MFEVDDNTLYSAVVNALQNKYDPLIRAYGTGAPSQTFTVTSMLGSTAVSVPVVSAMRIDWCPDATPAAVYSGTSLEKDYPCPSWVMVGQ